MTSTINLKQLTAAITGSAAAIRIITRLKPAGGSRTKIFPPTHSGGLYAWEMRRTGHDELVRTVLLDSVQSQANRMEQALLEAYRSQQLKFPLVETDFSNHFLDIGSITTLDASHRIADAIFRDSLRDGNKFPDSDIGQAFVKANIRNATALFQYCPHALIFGVWDSTGSAGGLGNKFQRAIVSEIIGEGADKGVATSSKIDSVGIKSLAIYKRSGVDDWTSFESEAERDSNGNLVPFKKKKSHKGVASEINHSNIPPDFRRFDPEDRKPLLTADGEVRPGDVLPGGVYLNSALQTTVLSLPALRRLRFPVGGKEESSTNPAARCVLAALALAAIVHAREQGYDLRSRCLLIPVGKPEFKLLANDGTAEPFTLNVEEANDIFKQSVDSAKAAGLPWNEEKITLQPEDRLIELIRRSRSSTAPAE